MIRRDPCTIVQVRFVPDKKINDPNAHVSIIFCFKSGGGGPSRFLANVDYCSLFLISPRTFLQGRENTACIVRFRATSLSLII